MLRRRSMSGNRRVKDSGLPEGYCLMNSVLNNSGKYIDTGVIPTENTRVVIDVALTVTNPKAYQAIFGARNEYTEQFWCYYHYSNKGYSFRYGDGTANPMILKGATERVLIDMKGGSMTIGDETVAAEDDGKSLSTQNTIFLFAVNSNGSTQYDCRARVYSCKIYEGAQLVRDYVPAIEVATRKSGLFDKVQGTFTVLTSAADFIGAQDVNGMLWLTADWDGSVEPNGVAIITSDCSFVVALENAPTTLPMNSEVVATESSSLPIISSISAIRTNYYGLGYTQILLSDFGDDVSEAAGYCNNYIFPNGNKGYLPSSGEMYLLYLNSSTINNVLKAIGGTNPSANQNYRTSARASNSGGNAHFWRLNFSTGAFSAIAATTASQVRPFTTLGKLVGKIENKIAVDADSGLAGEVFSTYHVTSDVTVTYIGVNGKTYTEIILKGYAYVIERSSVPLRITSVSPSEDDFYKYTF